MAAEKIVSDLSSKVEQVLGAIAERLGQGADHFWPIFVRQQQLAGWIFIAFYAVIVACFVTILVMFWRAFARDQCLYEAMDSSGKASFVPVISIVTGLLTVVLLVTTALNILAAHESILMICNPEYYALTDVIDKVLP